MNSKLDEAWKQAGTTMQVLAIFPTLLVVVMGIGGGGDFDVAAFLASIRTGDHALLLAALFVFFPFGPALGLTLLVLIAGICFHEFR